VGETGIVVNVETGEDQWEAIVLTDSSAKEISVSTCYVLPDYMIYVDF
jgi:hypothetical protein